MIVHVIHLNGRTKECEGCGDVEFRVIRFKTESMGKKYRHLYLTAKCNRCEKEIRMRVGKIKDLVTI